MCLYVEKAKRVPEWTQMGYRGEIVIGSIGGACTIGTWGICSIINTSTFPASSPIAKMILLALSRLASIYFQALRL